MESQNNSIPSLNESQQEYLDEDIIIAIPESMRNGLFRFIEKMVDKKVEIQVEKKLDQINQQMIKLQNLIESQKKGNISHRPSTSQNFNPPEVTPKRIQGIAKIKANGNKSKSPKSEKASTPRSSKLKSNNINGSQLKKPTHLANKSVIQEDLLQGNLSKNQTKIGGLKPLTELKSSTIKKCKDDDAQHVQQSPLKIFQKKIQQIVQKSAENQEVDEIYKSKDPIGQSIESRVKAGSLTSVVPDKNSKSGKFFFNLKLGGNPIVISEQAKKNAARLEGKVDSSGNIIEEQKPKPDPIEKALNIRISAPGSSMTTVVPSKDKQEEPQASKLRLKGGQPKVADPPKQLQFQLNEEEQKIENEDDKKEEQKESEEVFELEQKGKILEAQ